MSVASQPEFQSQCIFLPSLKPEVHLRDIFTFWYTSPSHWIFLFFQTICPSYGFSLRLRSIYPDHMIFPLFLERASHTSFEPESHSRESSFLTEHDSLSLDFSALPEHENHSLDFLALLIDELGVSNVHSSISFLIKQTEIDIFFSYFGTK